VKNKITALFVALIMMLPLLSVNVSSSSIWLSPEYKNTNTEASVEINALYNTLTDFLSDKSSQFVQSLNEQERIAFGEELKEAYIKGFEKDAYSRNLPFNSNYVRKVFDLCPIYFPDWLGAQVQQYSVQLASDSEDFVMTHVDIQLGIWLFDGDMASTFMHETGHLLGLGEGLTMLLENEYRGVVLNSKCDSQGDWRYDQCFSELLMKRAGKTKFWESAFTSQRAYEMLWNEHINVIPFQTFFETMKLNLVALTVYAYGDEEFAHILTDFERYANLNRYLLDEFGYIHDAFMRIEQGDSAQLSYANAFFEKVTSFKYSVWYDWEALNIVLTPTINYLNMNVHANTNVHAVIDAINLGSASSWAREGILSAVIKGFVSADIQNNYTDIITRQEFCRMAVQWVEYATGKSIDTVLSEQGKQRDPNAFTDTNDPYILAAFALGITSGVGNNLFNPSGQFNREQAATMIMNTCRAIGTNVNNPPSSNFADMGSAASWAVDGINFVRDNGIMQGTGYNNFSPSAPYTREQSIITFNNINHNTLPGR